MTNDFRDAAGVYWHFDQQTGAWHYYDGTRWVPSGYAPTGAAGGPGAGPQNPYWWSTATPSAAAPTKSTNGLAIASLVLSLLWIFGLGSLLAVIFGAVGRRQIRATNGRQGGEGLALAGLIIGIVGLVGLGGSIAVGIAYVSPSTTTLSYGQDVNFPLISAPRANGVATMTVVSPTNPTTSSAEPGNDVVSAGVHICATSTGMSHTPLSFEFTLLLNGGRSVTGVLDETSLSGGDVTSLGPNQCGSSVVTFFIPNGATPSGVQYHVGFPNRTYIWR